MSEIISWLNAAFEHYSHSQTVSYNFNSRNVITAPLGGFRLFDNRGSEDVHNSVQANYPQPML